MDYKIIWKGTDNDFNRLRRQDSTGKIFKPEIHVIHIMQGTLKGTDSHFNNPAVDASTGYGIGKSGEIHQYVRDEDAAWGQGLCTNPNFEWLKKMPGVNPNLYSLSYELEGMSGDSPTPEQWEALTYLLKLKSAAYDIPYEKNRFIGHYIIDPINRSGCPGKGFPWTKLYKELGITDAGPVVDNLPVLRIGSAGDDVKYLQGQLNKKGYNCGNVDGIFGPGTLKAVKAFQTGKNLEPDGIVGPLTWAKLT